MAQPTVPPLALGATEKEDAGAEAAFFDDAEIEAYLNDNNNNRSEDGGRTQQGAKEEQGGHGDATSKKRKGLRDLPQSQFASKSGKKALPWRRKFKLQDERDTAKEEFMVGSAQKQEVKSITSTWLTYFNEKQINGVLFNAMRGLLHLLELPENPFVFLSNQLRISELFYGLSEEQVEHFELNEIGPEDPETSITNVRGCDRIFGLSNILKLVDTTRVGDLILQLNCFEGLMASMSSTQGAYHVQFATALVGSAVYFGKLFPFLPHTVDVSEELVVSGPKFEKAVTIFANQIISQVSRLGHHSSVLVVGVWIEKTPHLKKKKTGPGGAKSHKRSIFEDDFKLWTPAKIKGSKTSFISAIKAATVSTREIIFDLIVELPSVADARGFAGLDEEEDEIDRDNSAEGHDSAGEDTGAEQEKRHRQRKLRKRALAKAGPGMPGDGDEETKDETCRFVQVQKYYTMYFYQTDQEGNRASSEVRSFAIFPFSSLCQGVFRTKEDAIFYAKLFTTPEGDCWTLNNYQDYHATFRAHLKTELVKEYIAGNLVAAVERLTALVAIAGRLGVIDDIRRLMLSSAGSLHGLVGWNACMRRVLALVQDGGAQDRFSEKSSMSGERHERHGAGHRGFANKAQIDKVVTQFRFYREQLLSVMASSESTEIIAMRRSIRQQLYEMCDHASKRLLIDPRHTLERLEKVNYTCEALELTVSRDVVAVLTDESFHKNSKLQSYDTIVKLIEEVIQQAMSGPQDDSSNDANGKGGDKAVASSKMVPKDNRRKRRSSIVDSPATLGAEKTESFDIFSEAGRESLEAFANEVQASIRASKGLVVVSVPNAIKVAKKKQNVPVSIAREAILLEYVTETRIDQVFEAIVHEILSNGKLYPNPFPMVVARLRAEAVRHEVWRERDSELVKTVSGARSRIKLVNSKNFLYKTAGHKVFGTFATLRTCDGATVEAIMKLLSSSGVICPSLGPNEDLTTSTAASAFDTHVSTSLGGAHVLYGRQHDFGANGHACLRECPMVTLFESHVYEGPRLRDAMDVFADFLVSHVLQVNDKTACNVALGVATGSYALDILNANPAFDGGWFPLSSVGPSAHSREPNDARSDGLEKMHHPRYSHGEFMVCQDLRREKALCKQELLRAVRAREPVVVRVATLVEGDGDPFYVVITKHVKLVFVQTPSSQVTSFCPLFCRYEAMFQSVWVDQDEALVAIQGVSNAVDAEDGNDAQHRYHVANPADPDNVVHKRYVRSLRLRIAHGCSRGDMLPTYRACLRFLLLTRDEVPVVDTLRMFIRRSMTCELDRLVQLNEVLQCVLVERFRSSESRKKLKAQTMLVTYHTYRVAVEDALGRQDCVYFPGIRNAIHTLLLKIEAAIRGDRIGTTVAHVEALEEVEVYLECIRISAARTLHRNCPHISEICRTASEELLSLVARSN